MGNLAIKVEHLGKQYQLGGQQARYATFREALVTAVNVPLRWLKGERHAQANTFWALNDVSFEVKHGEAVGIIGRNGAGKSTLLKILSRITSPTCGRVDLFGRVGSLLEVGTGFHPELTGRENIYLNGAILGMKRSEIKQKFDEIVYFSEIEKFLDTPVKHYSSGMYVRLAFAVAAHLDPEILLVDEVLAVGDAQFQKKCLGKMGEVTQTGRTVLFISHNMPAVQNLCQKAIVLHKGSLYFHGEVNQAIKYYMDNDNIETGVVDLSDNKSRFGSGELKILKFWMEDQNGEQILSTAGGERCNLVIEYISADNQERRNVSMSIHINTAMGMPISLINTSMLNQNFDIAPPHGIIKLDIPKLPLTTGTYVVDLNIATFGGQTYADFIKNAAAFEVTDGNFYGTGNPGNPGAPVMMEGNWCIQNTQSLHRAKQV